MFEIMEAQSQDAVIKVIGVGGCGGNAVDHMIEQGVQVAPRPGEEIICTQNFSAGLGRCFVQCLGYLPESGSRVVEKIFIALLPLMKRG